MISAEGSRPTIEQLADEFLQRYRGGELPAVSEYTERYPDQAEEIREVFAALILVEEAGPPQLAPAGAYTGKVTADGGAPRQLGDYRILREVGRGGMGVVYEAVQLALGRHVALKVLPYEAAANPTHLQRFNREARAAARLHHSNIVPVHDVGEHQGVHYYAMQFIQGQGLDEILLQLRHPLDGPAGSNLQSGLNAPNQTLLTQSDLAIGSCPRYYRNVARLGLQVAEALAYAHSQKVLHRDIKPSNLLLDTQGSLWITDFGLAKEEGDDLTRTGDVVGTLRYMAPERFSGISDARCDIYSLGLTLYELLALRPAFAESDRGRLISQITYEQPPRLRRLDRRIPRDLETIVVKACAKEPKERYQKAELLAEDLRRFLGDRPIRARRISWPEQTWRWCRRNPGWAATLTTIVGLLLIIATGGVAFSLDLREALAKVRMAERDQTEKLWQSYLERARAERSSGRVGQRFNALRALQEAAKIRVTPELRDEALAALVLPDAEIAREWAGCPETTLALAFDATFARYARLGKQGELSICRPDNNGEQVITPLPAHGKPPFYGLWLSPDGRFLAYGHSCGSDSVAGGLRVWKLEGVPTVLLDDTLGKNARALAFHPNGRLLAVGHPDPRGTISVYELEPFKLRRRVQLGHPAQNLAFHPADGRLAAACAGVIRLLDVDTGREQEPLVPSQGTWVEGLAWHPGGIYLATGGQDYQIHIWDTRNAAEVMTWEGHKNGVSLAFNHAGDRLATADWSTETRLWDFNNGRLILKLPVTLQLQFSRDDGLIGFRRDGSNVQLWRTEGGGELRMFRRRQATDKEEMSSPAVHADGRTLACVSRVVNASPPQEWLSFFDLDSGAELASTPLSGEKQGRPCAFIQGEGWLTDGAGHLSLWPEHPDPHHPDVLHIGPPRRLAHSADSGGTGMGRRGRLLAIPENNRAVVLDRDLPGWQRILEPVYDVRHCAVSPDGRRVATCGWFWDGRISGVQIWDSRTGGHVLDLPFEENTSARFSPDGRWLAAVASGQGRLWEVGTWQPGIGLKGFLPLFMPDGSLFAVNDVLGATRFVETRTGREIFRLASPEPAWHGHDLACFTPDGGRLIATGSGYAPLYVWDLRLIRQRLKELNLDWDWPEPAPPSSIVAPVQRQIVVDPGFLRPRPFPDDRQTIAVFSLCLALSPINPEAYLQRGLAHGRLRNSRSAIADYDRFLALAAPEDARRTEVLCRRASNYHNQQDHAGTAAALREILKVEPDRLPWPDVIAQMCNDVARHFARSSLQQTWPDNVEAIARKAVQIEPENAGYRITLGTVLYRLGRGAEAAAVLRLPFFIF
jgi:WD40 repeat protein